MTNQDKERAVFDAWYTNKHSMASTIRLASGRYYSTLVESAWQGWLASAERSAKRIAELENQVSRFKKIIDDCGYPLVVALENAENIGATEDAEGFRRIFAAIDEAMKGAE